MHRPERRLQTANRVMAMVMAGGQGSRLQPLTATRSKPAVPFGSRYRVVDFVLSNLVNSGILTIYLLVQYKSQSLIEHVRKAWTISPLFQQQFVTIVPPQMLSGEGWFQGTADAIGQNLNLIELHHPELVLVLGADHVYRMDVHQMIRFHIEREADITIAGLPVPIADAGSFGIIAADPDGRVHGFQEKPGPEQAIPIPGDPRRAYGSMGNYLFRASTLVQALREAKRREARDFGQDVLPRLLATRRVFAYDFSDNRVPGVKPYEEHAYWRDVGSIDAYFQAHQDLLGDQPRFDLFNPGWPIYSSNYQGPVARVRGGEIDNALLGAATEVRDARLRNTIVRRETVIEEGADLEDCVIMDYTRIGRGARLRRAIVDRHNRIESNARIGLDPDQDSTRYTLSPAGVVVVARGQSPYFARGGRGLGSGYDE